MGRYNCIQSWIVNSLIRDVIERARQVKMPKGQSHLVRLVGTDNQEQAVLFDIESTGVHLSSEKGQVNKTFCKQ